ncbi:MAG: ABC transporter permease [Chloroflexi bacterium]|nr:MAG: ABC transporter permease [Chloroflexota bacterium]
MTAGKAIIPLLNGDTLYLYSKRWPGRRFVLSVRAIVVDGGLVGSTPYILAQNKTFLQFEGYRDAISEVFISLHNNIDTNGVDLSERAEDAIRDYIPAGASIHEVQEQGVHASQQADDIFSRIFSLFALFALAIGLLLIFLIFVLLAAERRAEMGMARAIGVQRRHLILMYLFEGTVYDLLSSFVGLLIGVGVGTLLVLFLEPILERFNFPLKLVFQPRSLILAYCLGVIFTFFSVGVSAWLVSRMTVVDALRNLTARYDYRIHCYSLAARHSTPGSRLRVDALRYYEIVDRALLTRPVIDRDRRRVTGEGGSGMGAGKVGQAALEAGSAAHVRGSGGTVDRGVLGTAIRRAGAPGPAAFSGRDRGFLYRRGDDGAGSSVGAGGERGIAAQAAHRALHETAGITVHDAPGLGLSPASSFPHRSQHRDVQPGNFRHDGDGGDYQCHAEQLYLSQLPD